MTTQNYGRAQMKYGPNRTALSVISEKKGEERGGSSLSPLAKQKSIGTKGL